MRAEGVHEEMNTVSQHQLLLHACARPRRRVRASERDAPVRISHSWSDMSPSPFCSGSGSSGDSGSLWELHLVVGSKDALKAASERRSRRAGALALRTACQCIDSVTRCTWLAYSLCALEGFTTPASCSAACTSAGRSGCLICTNRADEDRARAGHAARLRTAGVDRRCTWATLRCIGARRGGG